MLNNNELRELSQTSAFKSTLAIAMDWAGTALLFALAIWYPHPLMYLFCAIMMGRQQIAFAVLMHDGAHRRLYKSTLLNEYIGQFFTAAPLFFSMFSYRRLHLKHHRDPLVPDDPDITLTGGYPIETKSFVRKLLRDLFRNFLLQIHPLFYLSSSGGIKTRSPKGGVVQSLTQGESYYRCLELSRPSYRERKNSVLVDHWLYDPYQWIDVGNLIFFGAWLALSLWVIPMMTVLQVLLRIRGVAEHAGYQPNKDQRLNSRTVISPLQTFFFAPHGVFYHVEHHQYPSVPFYNLPKVHELMKERGSLQAGKCFCRV